MRLRKAVAVLMAVFMTAGYMPVCADDGVENPVPVEQTESEVIEQAQAEAQEVADSDPAERSENMPDETQTYMGITMDSQDDMQAEDESDDNKGLLSFITLKANAEETNSARGTNPKRVYGIDVSEHQKKIDWKKTTTDGVEYAIIRVGGRGYGTGSLYADSYYQTNIKNAQAAGLPVGVYFFSQGITVDEAIAEADYTCELIKDYDIDLPVFMDYEYAADYRLNNGASVEERTKVIRAFCEEVMAKGHEAGIYTGGYLASTAIDGVGLSQDYWMWIATYGSSVYSGYKGLYDFWQYTSTGSVLGITGNVDVDCWFKSDARPGNEQVKTYPMYRLYNKNNGEHFYTADEAERDNLVEKGWQYEGLGWTATTDKSVPVYRLYNKNGGEHHYTTSAKERDMLAAVGGNYEKVGWYSDPNKSTPLYRVYNPNAFANNHFYTTSKAERDYLVSIGWENEGIGWDVA